MPLKVQTYGRWREYDTMKMIAFLPLQYQSSEGYRVVSIGLFWFYFVSFSYNGVYDFLLNYWVYQPNNYAPLSGLSWKIDIYRPQDLRPGCFIICHVNVPFLAHHGIILIMQKNTLLALGMADYLCWHFHHTLKSSIFYLVLSFIVWQTNLNWKGQVSCHTKATQLYLWSLVIDTSFITPFL